MKNHDDPNIMKSIDVKYVNYLHAIMDKKIRYESFCKREYSIIDSLSENQVVKYYSEDSGFYAVIHKIVTIGANFNYYLIHVILLLMLFNIFRT
jgi:hypothetical protein